MSRQVFSKNQRRKYNSAYLNKKINNLPHVIHTKMQISNKSQSSLISQCASQSLLQRIKQKHMFDLTHYEEMSEIEIKKQYRQLRQTLKSMNMQIAYHLSQLEMVPLPIQRKLIDNSDVLNIMDKQSQNNQRLQLFLQNEWNILQRRQRYLEQHTRQTRETEIRKAIQDIEKTKQKIRKIKRTSIAMSHSLLDEQSLIRQIKDLEKSKAFIKQKNDKIRQQLNKCNESNDQMIRKNTKIQRKFIEAQKNMLSLVAQQNQQAKMNKMEMMMAVKQGVIKQLNKKMQISKSQNEQQYFSKLKQLDKIVQSINQILNKNMEIEGKIVVSKKQVALLARQCKNMRKIEKSADNLLQQTKAENTTINLPFEQRILNKTIHEVSRSSLGHTQTILMTDIPPPDREPTPPMTPIDLPKMKTIHIRRVNKFFNQQTTLQQS